jgi:hypothetical protein
MWRQYCYNIVVAQRRKLYERWLWHFCFVEQRLEWWELFRKYSMSVTRVSSHCFEGRQSFLSYIYIYRQHFLKKHHIWYFATISSINTKILFKILPYLSKAATYYGLFGYWILLLVQLCIIRHIKSHLIHQIKLIIFDLANFIKYMVLLGTWNYYCDLLEKEGVETCPTPNGNDAGSPGQVEKGDPANDTALWASRH